ncbi:bifunctional 3,4-dihydroxy-2-butanone 4-phosphate synthase/GTP cyclohydrolase II [Caminibacter mediatlanticus]|uniref:3,4-dihydroxy-2-butanone 4-phosphate synthase n=1 Tax=Caminibacter mediatlanticus TB-2 TaxID=391592 RepID=A0AAI9AGA4_9BACT|nr:bifunctional 3,4-dihydroxy-2-butanone 4-phosphate synthase/GTP cyclohydrolase II [Caminibacter mediatlanticus]EDM23080.1 bifunctional 3,4-dihydroxy-2-butanone 4-phosphate synthase/GTP cyclohydrolase II protein [Caminibacter mediatlanticus TB-2]
MESINRVKKAIEDIQKGKMIIMIDDEDRENEGDLVYAGVFSTPEKVNFLAKEGRGLICVSLTKEIANKLDLKPMISENKESFSTAFTISVDAKETKTGISAYERDLTIKKLSTPTSKPDDFVKPGHIFPLIAKDGGVLVRTGHTEGSVDICKLAGLYPSAVICEIMNEDGTMARRDDLKKFAKKHNLSIVYISDIVEYKLQFESLIKKEKEENIKINGVEFKKITFKDHLGNRHYVLANNPKETSNVKFFKVTKNVDFLLNEKMLNEYNKAIEYIKYNNGVIIFIDSNSKDNKEFGIGAQILKNLGIKNLNLISNHKSNLNALKGFGINIKKYVEI